MPKYNPNSIWDSKKKESDLYAPTKKSAPGVGSVPLRRPGEPNAKTEEPFFKKVAIPPPGKEMDRPPGNHHAIYWSIGIFVVLVGGGLLAFFLLRPTAGPNVSIAFPEPSGEVPVGEPFTLSVSLLNNSPSVIKNPILSISLPDNVSFVGQSADQRVMERTIDDLDPHDINSTQEYQLIVTGDPQSVKQVTAKLIYSTDSSPNAQFETDGALNMQVGNAAIELGFTPPSSVFSGQNFSMTVSYVNNTADTFNDAQLAMEYPPAFTFVRSTAAATNSDGDLWNLGNIGPAATGTITIIGNIVGPQSAVYPFDANLQDSDALGNTYVLNSQTANLSLTASPLSLGIMVNNSSTYISQANDTLNYVLTYTNNSSVTFQNITLKAVLTGAMFDFTTLQSNGSFSSVNDTVTWNGGNTPALLSLAPGQSGSVTFQLKTKASFPIRLVSDKNYTLGVTGQISSGTVPPGTVASSTTSVVNVQSKVGGDIVVAAKGIWHEPSSVGITNTGPFPPKVNKPTQYTIHWDITNYSTDAENVTVSAYLQSGTTCTGKIKSNLASSTPTCDPANGLITWNIPLVPATTGITGAVAEAIIQVVNTPAVNQVGSLVTLLGPTTLQATDAFTGLTLQANAPAVTTDLTYDTSVSNENGQVTQ